MLPLKNKRKASNSVIGILFVFLNSPYSQSMLITELQELLSKYLSDGILSSAQYNYITYELKDIPNCDEIMDLINSSGIETRDLKQLISHYCDKKREEISVPKKKAKKSKKVDYRGYFWQYVYPKNYEKPVYFGKLKGMR